MEELEDLLKQVESLKKDFSAEDKFVPDIVLDMQKRESVKQQLQQVYDLSGWYSARYAAGRALGIGDEELDSQINSWLEVLAKDISNEGADWKYYGEDSPNFDIFCPRGREFVIYDKKVWDKFCTAKNDLRYLYKIVDNRIVRQKISLLLKITEIDFLTDEMLKGFNLSKDELRRIYRRCESMEDECSAYYLGRVACLAGKQLGYNSLRIWAHENPLRATVIAGAISGLGYMLYQYLSRF
ncbi:MAG: hypothetical protein Q8N99_05975 [Nanoarchaeota archaeon]|nr:hypothetical protein [Nanoarchaeota archaeon]